MKVGVITGSGTDTLPGLAPSAQQTVATPYGTVEVTEGLLGGVATVHLSRHGTGHARLSNHVTHRANLAALLACRVDAVVAVTICGAVDPAVEPGSLVVFDDLYFPSNRLPDGSLCTWYDEPGGADRGHWIVDRPFSAPLRTALVAAARACGETVVDGGCYGHVDGPRFNTRTEVAALAAAGVTAISQTGGPETVLAGEAELPFALLGFVTDRAAGVGETTEPVDALLARMAASGPVIANVLNHALPTLTTAAPAGSVYRFTP